MVLYCIYRFQGLHHQFLASALAVKMAHEIDPNYQVGCMQIMATNLHHLKQLHAFVQYDFLSNLLYMNLLLFHHRQSYHMHLNHFLQINKRII